MKKAVILVLSGFLTLSMVACINTEIQSGSSDDPSLSSETDLVEPIDSMAEEPTENENDIISEQYEIGDIILLKRITRSRLISFPGGIFSLLLFPLIPDWKKDII